MLQKVVDHYAGAETQTWVLYKNTSTILHWPISLAPWGLFLKFQLWWQGTSSASRIGCSGSPSWLTIVLYHLFNKNWCHSMGIYYTPTLWTLQEYEVKGVNSLRANVSWLTERMSYQIQGYLWIHIPRIMDLYMLVRLFKFILLLRCEHLGSSVPRCAWHETLGLELRWAGSHRKLFYLMSYFTCPEQPIENGNRPGKMAQWV